MKDRRSNIINSLKSKFAKSIVIPLISIFVVVLAVIVFIVFRSFTSEIKANAIDKKMQQLSNTEQSITARISEVNSISLNISEDSQFSFVPLLSKKYSGYEMAKSLQKLLVGNSFVSYLSYYRTSETDKIYTSKGEMQFHTFWNSYINFADESEEQYLDQIKVQTGRKVFPVMDSKNGKSFLTIIYPIPLLTSHPSAYVITYIDGKNIDNIASSLFADCQGEILIYDLNDVLIYNYVSSGKDSLQEEMKDKVEKLTKEKPYCYLTVKNQDYILLKHKSSYNGWSYISLIRKGDITGSLTAKQVGFLLILITITVLAIVAVMALVLFNYQFVNRLAQTVSKNLNLDDNNETDEQLLLSNAFLALMEKAQSTTQNLFLANLIAGQYDETTIASAVNEYNISFEYSKYVACVTYFHGTQDVQICDELFSFVKEHFDRNEMTCYPICQTNPNRILIIVNGSEEVLEWSAFEPVLSNLYYRIAGEFNQTVSIGVGKNYPDPHKVYDSAFEALSAMYFCILEGERYIKRYIDIDMEAITMNISDITARIINTVRHGNTEEMLRLMKEFQSVINTHGFSIQHQNYIAYSLLSALKEYVDDPGIYNEVNGALVDLLKRTHVKNLKIFDKIENLCIMITEHRKEARSCNKNTELINTIIQVMTENLFDSMMSLESISEKCGISPSYLSRVFKAKMGSTPMYYVENLRMSKVKEKLCNTNESLKQILIDTGYIDQSNFIRKFKKMEGVTPMTYRKMHQDNTEH
jgi:AraC-like DNA-binding protein/flagellar basal body-associated protein FliL